MIRRSPCELYIKYLLVHPDGFKTPDILNRLREEQLDFLSEAYVEALRKKCVPPVTFHPFEFYHPVSQRFLMKHGLRELFHPNDHVAAARRILRHAKAKEFIEAMILSGAPANAIAKMLSMRFRVPCSSDAVEMYRQFFWNTDLVDSTEMRALLAMRVDPDTQGIPENDLRRRSAKAMEKASFSDPRRVAANLPSSPMSALIAQMRMGFMPSGLDVGATLALVQALASVRLFETVTGDGYKDSNKGVEWSIVLKNVTEVMETVVKPDANMREQLSSLLLKTDTSSVPILRNLTGGSHTVEMEPVQETVDEADVVEE